MDSKKDQLDVAGAMRSQTSFKRTEGESQGSELESRKRAWVGAWIRFYYNGRLVIGEVAYARENPHYPWGLTLHTDHGTVEEKEVLERRDRQ